MDLFRNSYPEPKVKKVEVCSEALPGYESQGLPPSWIQKILSIFVQLHGDRPANELIHGAHHSMRLHVSMGRDDNKEFVFEFGTYGLRIIEQRHDDWVRHDYDMLYSITFPGAVQSDAAQRLIKLVESQHVHEQYSAISRNCQHFVEEAVMNLCGIEYDPDDIFFNMEVLKKQAEDGNFILDFSSEAQLLEIMYKQTYGPRKPKPEELIPHLEDNGVGETTEPVDPNLTQ